MTSHYHTGMSKPFHNAFLKVNECTSELRMIVLRTWNFSKDVKLHLDPIEVNWFICFVSVSNFQFLFQEKLYLPFVIFFSLTEMVLIV